METPRCSRTVTRWRCAPRSSAPTTRSTSGDWPSWAGLGAIWPRPPPSSARARRAVAPELAAAVASHLGALALPGARMEVDVQDSADHPGAGEAVEFRLAANTGVAPASLSRVASGGELSRVMLALRLVLSEGPPTMVFDEVDAGIGGEAAVAVGRALAELGQGRQVIVVTHLAQVAACTDTQIRVHKSQDAEGAVTTARVLDGDDRVVELSRMLSGSPDSEVARRHAEELLGAVAGARRGPTS